MRPMFLICVKPGARQFCPFRRMTDRLDAVAIGIEDECTIIARVILRPQSRRPVVATSIVDCQAMKLPDRRAVVRAKTQVHALRGLDAALGGDRELHAERPRRRSIVRAAVVAEIDDPHEAEWPQYSVVEAAAWRQVG